jgi:acyl-CoA synthetase (AMP-forming)/AMP-acid ligase II
VTTIAVHARRDPERVALIIDADGSTLTYGELERRTRRLAGLLRARGLGFGDSVAVMLPNVSAFLEVFWACHRVGLYFVPVNWHLQPDEVSYIVDNCGARALFAHGEFAEVAALAAESCPGLGARFALGGPIALGAIDPDAPLGEELEGSYMLYSSGTTGRPKGVKRPLVRMRAGQPEVAAAAQALIGMFGIGPDDRYLCPAPLYHAAPVGFTSSVLRIGGSVVVMARFDAERALQLIEQHRVTTSQWVPTHFKRLLELPEETRKRYDLSSLRVAVHAAAPCPVPIKEAMIRWWGDAIVEYYAGSEGGGTKISAREWLEHKGSVGRHFTGDKIWILDDDGHEVPAGTDGLIYFDTATTRAGSFEYHGDAAKTASVFRGTLYTLGDVGHLDADGYLYLTDRQSHMIISGGVNIYPQEIENQLIAHPKVYDAAVIGVPDEDMGEQVKAVVVPADGATPGPALERELIEHCRASIAHYKCPRSVDFVAELPRTPAGKLRKGVLRARYWEGRASRLV